MLFVDQIDIDKTALPQDPVFIVGCPRSGTTLLQSLLATQQGIFTFPETHFFTIIFRHIKKNENGYIIRSCLEQVFSAIEQMIELQFSEQIKKKILAASENNALGIKTLFEIIVCSLLHKQVNRSGNNDYRWLEKTPGHFLAIETISALYPSASFVAMVREPSCVIQSRKKNIPQEKNYSVRILAAQWNKAISAFENFLKKNPDRIHVLKYENLVTNLEEEMGALCRFLKIDFQSDRLNKYKDQAEKVILTKEKWKNNVTAKTIMSSNDSANKNLKLIDILQIQHMTQNNLKKYGYHIKHKNIQQIFSQTLNVLNPILYPFKKFYKLF